MPEQPTNDEQAEIKKRAMQRLAVAASLVAAAVVTLTVLNHKKPEAPQTVATSTAPVVAQAEPAQPEAVAGIPLEEEQPAEPLAEPTPPVPDTEAAPATPPAPPPPQVINRVESAKSRAEIPAAKPSAAKPASIETPVAAKPPVTPIAQNVAPQPVAPAAAPVVGQKPVAAAKTTEAPPLPAKPAADPAAPKGYVVQLGLFSNPDNALQLQKRLAEHGIKSYTETRLHVGPFPTKAEADQAQAKIRSLGINAVLAPVR